MQKIGTPLKRILHGQTCKQMIPFLKNIWHIFGETCALVIVTFGGLYFLNYILGFVNGRQDSVMEFFVESWSAILLIWGSAALTVLIFRMKE